MFAIQPDDVVFDVGASVGLMTVYAASEAFKGRVFAFEPDPETMRRLRRNVPLEFPVERGTSAMGVER